MNGPARTYDWPCLMVDEWTATRDTLHMWAETVGKIRMVHMPLLNHWWQAQRGRPRYPVRRGLSAR
jgi:hypothetical protein